MKITKIYNFLLFLALISPCIPKVQISKDITMFPYEIVALLCFPFLLRTIKFSIQRCFFAVWLLILFATLISQVDVYSVGGVMRCVKELIYIPLMYIAYRSRWLNYKLIVKVFCVACFINLFYLFSEGFRFGVLDIWNNETMSSGMSNKAFNLQTFSVERILTGGSHGIWLTYSNICVCIAYACYLKKWILGKFFFIALILGMLNLAMSVSREGLIIFAILVLGISYGKLHNSKGQLQISPNFILLVAVIVSAVIYVIVQYGEEIAIVQKVLYTQKSLNSNGSEGNIAMRIGGWIVYFKSIIANPLYLIVGYGFNTDAYLAIVKDIARPYGDKWVPIPESFFVETLMYGGLLCFYFGIRLWIKMYQIIREIGNNSIRYSVIGLFLGILFGNIFSGATIISDVVYSYVLICLGLLLRYREELLTKKNN